MIFIHHYELHHKKNANSQTKKRTQQGCLIKVEDQFGNFGVADLCPWPTLGDLTLQEELSQKGPLYVRCLELACKDLEARKNKIKLVTDQPIKNHLLIQDYKNFNFSAVTADFIKIKCDENILDLIHLLNTISKFNFLIRLDFNFCLTELKFNQFLSFLSEQTLKKIDVIEDPFYFDLKSWSDLNQKVRLALDWNPQNHEWPQRICKPSHGLTESFLYLTSSMDHPVGVAHGLSFAQNNLELTHGFLTLDSYEKTDFHSDFLQIGSELIYKNNGFGIGFEKQLSEIQWQLLIDFSELSKNQILMDVKLPVSEKNILFELFEKFNTTIIDRGYFLIPSSGSSRSVDESLKLIILKKSAILNSAIRVNEQFNLTVEMNWGCVIPTYHVGGLGIIARAYKSGAQVYFMNWKKLLSSDFQKWFFEKKIQVLSLVPAQIFDLVQNKIQCPEIIKYVFVGGSELSNGLAQKAVELGWPLIQTYGMTETASMIAFKKNHTSDYFELMRSVQIFNSSIQCDSLASYSIQKIKNDFKIIKFDQHIEISDQIEATENTLRFLGRSEDKVQILSETVSMFQLRSKLEMILIENNLNMNEYALMALADKRAGSKLVLVGADERPEVIAKYNSVVRSYERIQEYIYISEIPQTNLGKILYGQLRDLLSIGFAKIKN